MNVASHRTGGMQDQRDLPSQRMHPDFMTYLPGIEYFYFGNGDILGAVQYCPDDPRGTFLGFTFMSPEHFCRKWSTFLYHPERGLQNTRLGVSVDEQGRASAPMSGMYYGVKGYSVDPQNFRSIAWTYPDRVPVVSVVWNAGLCLITEEFFVPADGALIFRRISVVNNGDAPCGVGLSLSLYANFGLFSKIATVEKTATAEASGLAAMRLSAFGGKVTVAGRYDVRVDLGTIPSEGSREAMYVYALGGGERLLRTSPPPALWKNTARSWKTRSTLETGVGVIDDLFRVSQTGLRAVLARNGRMDAGTWQYNMEWVGDQMLAAEALLRAGFIQEAKVILEKNLRDGIGPDGRTIESSRWFGYEYTELGQNGMVLYAVWAYVCWTGDLSLVRKYWPAIRRAAEFPLMEVFRDPRSLLVHNKREFWERSDAYGFEDGYELGYQFWVAMGLEKGADVADLLGQTEIAAQWRDSAAHMQHSLLEDPVFRFIEDGHLIKRRTRDGSWKKILSPPDRSKLPPGSPIATEEMPCTEPDTSEVFPIIYEMIDPGSALAASTLRWIEQLWNQRWEGGGYALYNISGSDNSPAPWPIMSVLVARAYAAARDDEKVWRVLRWLYSLPGGKSGSLFERYGQSITPPMPPVGVNGWVWYELIALCVHHMAGVRPGSRMLEIRPWLIDGVHRLTISLNVRGTRIDLLVRRSEGKQRASVDGREVAMMGNALHLRYPLNARHLTIDMEV